MVPILLFKGKYRIPLLDTEHNRDEVIERPYGLVFQHFSKPANTFLTCSAGLAIYYENGEEVIDVGDGACVPCHSANENGKEGGISFARKLHIFNAVLLADFHEVESEKVSEKTGKPYKSLIQCKGRRCSYCRSGKEITFGRTVYWPIGTSFVEQLANHDIVTLASQCECGGDLEPFCFECHHCHETFVNLEDEEISDERLADLRDREITCTKCNTTDYLDEIPECNSCSEPRPLTMWNTVMEMFRSGEGVNTSLGFSKSRPVTKAELERVRHLMDPADIERIYPIVSIKEQAEKFKIPNPFNKNDTSARRSDQGHEER